MAITTAAQARAGLLPPVYFSKAATGTMVAGRPFNLSRYAGTPAAMAYPPASPTTGTTYSANVTGQIPFPSAGGGNTYLAKFSAISSATPGMLLLCDMIYATPPTSLVSTGSAIEGPVSIPARDALGGTNGDGLNIALEVTTAGGTGALNISMTYQDGAANESAAWLINAAQATSAPASVFLPCGSNDTVNYPIYGAAKMISPFINSGLTAGAGTFMIYRILATLEIRMAGQRATAEFPSLGMPRCYDGTVPFLVFIPAGTATTLISGSVTWAKG